LSDVGVKVSVLLVVSFPAPAAKLKLPKAPNVASVVWVPAPGAALNATVKAFCSVLPLAVTNRTSIG
jgi:hypothetical protein